MEELTIFTLYSDLLYIKQLFIALLDELYIQMPVYVLL